MWCGAELSSRRQRVHVGQSVTGSEVFACPTCPGADRPQTLRQPWCRADRRQVIAVRRYDRSIAIAHAKIVPDETMLPLSPRARALIYFNPNSRQALILCADQVRKLGQWLARLAGELAGIDAEGKDETKG